MGKWGRILDTRVGSEQWTTVAMATNAMYHVRLRSLMVVSIATVLEEEKKFKVVCKSA